MKRCRLGEKVFTLAGLLVFLLLFLSNHETAAMTPPSAPGSEKIRFLHHSTGACVYFARAPGSPSGPNNIPLKLGEYNTAHGTAYNISEQNFCGSATQYNTIYGWSNYPFDYWKIWIENAGPDYYLQEPTLEYLTRYYDVIIWKHCYPVAQILADTGLPDITSSVKRLENYKLQYNALKEKMLQYPNTKFIVWTLASMTDNVLSVSQADRGRTFVDWMKNVWDEPNDNIYIWNFYDIETGGDGLQNKFMLDAYAVDPAGDCHPNNTLSNDIAAPSFLDRIIEVLQANHAPYGGDQSTTTSANTAVNITLVATDADGNPLTYSIVTAPAHGTLTGSGANRTYTPSVDYTGTDSFTFNANDGLVDSNEATVSITVTVVAVNHAPVAQNQNVTTNEDTATAITLAATDEDGNPLTYSIVSAPTHGALTGSGASRTYTPSANYYGVDSFTFKANDGTADSNTATVSITVTSVNDAPLISVGPTATPNPVTLPGTASVSVTASDADSGALTYTWEKVSGSGTVGFSPNGTTGSATSVATFSAAGNYVLRIRVSDGSSEATGEVTVTVNAIQEGLAGHWKLDETTGTTAADSAGADNNGTLVNGPVWTTGGKLDGALSFDGVNDFVLIPDANVLDNTQKLTVAFWVCPAFMDGQARGLVSKRVGYENQESYDIFFTTGNRIGFGVDGPGQRAYTNTVFQTGTWYHVALVYDGTLPSTERMKLYVNGLLDKTAAETSASIPNYASNVNLGILEPGYPYAFQGLMDDVRIYQSAMTSTEVAQLVNTAPSITAGPTASPNPVILPGTASVSVTANDADGSTLTYTWEKVSGSGTVGFSPNGTTGSATSVATFGATGSYVLRIRVSDGSFEVAGEVTVTVTQGGLAGHWKLDETTGTTAVDSAGADNNGTLMNDPVWTTSGKLGGALSFDGVDDFVLIPDADALDNTQKLTVAFWMRPELLDGQARGLVSKRVDYENQESYDIFFTSGNKICFGVDGPGQRAYTNTVFQTDKWYHVALVFDGTLPSTERMKLYVNGALDKTAAETSATIPNYASNVHLGTLNPGRPAFQGLMDNVRIYQSVLTDTEIAQMAEREDNLVGHWKLDETTGTTATDSAKAGADNNGTLMNGPVWTGGKLDGALSFDGVDDFVLIPDADALDNTQKLTVAFWMRPELLDGQARGLVSKRVDYENQESYNIFFTTGNRICFGVDGPGQRAYTNTVFQTDKWYHVALVFDGTLPSTERMKLYVNGLLDKTAAETSASIPNYASNVHLGTLNPGRPAFQGLIDDVRICQSAMTQQEVAQVVNITPPVTFGHWKLDETAGTKAMDSSGGENNGTLMNGPVWTTGGKLGGALSFDGANDLVLIPDADALDNTQKLTVAFWVRPEFLDGQARGLVSKRLGYENQESYDIFFTTGNRICFGVDGPGQRAYTNTVFQTGTWYHVALVFDGTLPSTERMKLYVNGILDKTAAEASASIPNYASNVHLGILEPGYPYAFQGLMDDVRICQSAMTDAEIAQMVNEVP